MKRSELLALVGAIVTSMKDAGDDLGISLFPEPALQESLGYSDKQYAAIRLLLEEFQFAEHADEHIWLTRAGLDMADKIRPLLSDPTLN